MSSETVNEHELGYLKSGKNSGGRRNFSRFYFLFSSVCLASWRLCKCDERPIDHSSWWTLVWWNTKKENKFSFSKNSKTKEERREREREREKRMAVLTELGEGQSAGLGLGHNSDVRIFRLWFRICVFSIYFEQRVRNWPVFFPFSLSSFSPLSSLVTTETEAEKKQK